MEMGYCCSVLSDSLRPHGLQHARPLSLTVSRSLPKFMSTASVMPSSHLTLWHSLLLLPSIFPSIRDFSNEMASHQMIKILEFQLQHQSFQQAFKADFPWDWLVWSCCLRDSQESSPAPQCERISSLALCLLYGPALKTIHDHWKDHSLDLSKWIVKK